MGIEGWILGTEPTTPEYGRDAGGGVLGALGGLGDGRGLGLFGRANADSKGLLSAPGAAVWLVRTRQAADQFGHSGALLGLKVSDLVQAMGKNGGVHQVFLD